MKKTIQLLLSGTKEIVWYLFQVAVLSGALVLVFKCCGDMLEPICEHMNVGFGLLFIFAVMAVFIYIDHRNAAEEKQRSTGRDCATRQQALR